MAATIKDSMYSDEKIKTIEAIGFKEHLHQLELENEKVQIEQDAEKERQKIITYSIGAVLLLVALFAGFVFRSLKVARKQNAIIEMKNKETQEQKEIIEEKNKAVMDSIRYASRIQRALITSENYIAIQLNRLKKN